MAVNDPEKIRTRQSLHQLAWGKLKSLHSRTEPGLKEEINCSTEEVYDWMTGRVVLGGRLTAPTSNLKLFKDNRTNTCSTSLALGLTEEPTSELFTVIRTTPPQK